MSDAPEEFEGLLRLQEGVFRRDQVSANMVSRGRVRAQVAADRWQELGPTLLVTHNGPLTPEQQRWAAVLAAGDRGYLGGRTAFSLAGLTGWDDGQIHVVAPHGHRWPELPGIALQRHTTRTLRTDDLNPVLHPRRTRVERSAIDAAVWSRSPRTASGLLVAAVQQRLTTADRLSAKLARSGRIRHRGVLKAVLLDVAGGAQALTEIDFGRLCRDFGLPAPRRQVVRVDHAGRRRYVDAEIVGPDGTAVSIEVDGAPHMAVDAWIDDADRGNELQIVGDRVLRFPSIVFRLHPERVADQIRRALGISTGVAA